MRLTMREKPKGKTGGGLRGWIQYLAGFIDDIRTGGLGVRLSLLICGSGYFAQGQWIKGALVTLTQAAVILVYPLYLAEYLAKFDTLGTVVFAQTFDMTTMKNVTNDYDHSFKILLFSLVGVLVLALALAAYIKNIRNVRALERMVQQKGLRRNTLKREFCELGNMIARPLRNVARAMRGAPQIAYATDPEPHVNCFREDLHELMDRRFHVSLLTLPSIGVVVFTIIPLLVMILTAFTNYDRNHMVPANLFTWVGLDNFKSLFSDSLSITFGYSFVQVLGWTLVWAVLATFTNYYGGIFLAMFINNNKTKAKKFWRTCFMVTIAVPQFVSLLLVRNFFANTGIVNTLFAQWGLTDFFKQVGLLPASYTYIPFLTEPGWAKVMIVLINMWVGVPYMMIMSTGILMNIPADILESAKIDGANAFQRFRKITMPYIRFVTGPYLVTSIVTNINNFNIIYLLTNEYFVTKDQMLANSNAREVDLLVTWLYRLTQSEYNYKMASVLGIMIFIICAAFTLVCFRRLTRGDREERFQ